MYKVFNLCPLLSSGASGAFRICLILFLAFCVCAIHPSTARPGLLTVGLTSRLTPTRKTDIQFYVMSSYETFYWYRCVLFLWILLV